MKILLVEDDQAIVRNLKEFLGGEGYAVSSASCRKEALSQLEHDTFDLLLLDVSLPDGNGYSLCSAAKALGDIPIIFLTAADDEYSVVAGFEMGADDYIGKPFRPRELLSRIKNVLRRSGKDRPVVRLGDVEVDTLRGTVRKNGRELFLSALEYRLLLTFANNREILLTRSRLLDEIWDASGEFVNDNTLTVYIKRLREKIEDDPQNPRIIRTVRGLGYKAGDSDEILP